jgi:hypothetical protein
MRYGLMTSIEKLRLAMEAAAEAEDFETASRLRDQISLMRAGGSSATEDIDPSGLERQQPGAMGLGTSRQKMTPPAGWIAPRKPDLLTKGRSRRGPKL